jgi:hypothetical protein
MKIRSLIAISALGSMLFVQTGFAATAAVLNSAGAVQVNGRNVPSTTPVFAGDKLQTNDQSTGTVSIADTSLQIHPGSNVVYSNDSLELIKGAATVKTNKAYRAMVHGLSIRPEAAASEFKVQADASKVTISALKGSLAIGSHIKLPQGQTLVLAAANAPQNGCVDNHKTDGSGKFLLDAQGRFINCVDQNTAGGATTTTITDNTKTWTVVTFAAAAAVGGGMVAWVKDTDKAPISPAVP